MWFEYHSVDSRGEVIDVAKTQSESLNGTKSSILGAKLDKGCVCKNINGSARKGHTEFGSTSNFIPTTNFFVLT